jgi:glycerol-3-phosphate dehydrogenase (NAD(P)+)
MGEAQTERPRWLIYGAGSFGTAFARLMARRDVAVTLGARRAEHVEELRNTRKNERYAPGVELPEAISFLTLDEAVQQQWDTIVLAVPTRSFEEAMERCAGHADSYVSLAKGLAPGNRRVSEVAGSYVDADRVVVVTGPNISHEILGDLPTAAVVAGSNSATVERVQRQITSFAFRVYSSDDLCGVELAGATKNVVAIAAGLVEAVGFGDNGLASLTTRGLGEMARFGMANGAKLETYLGLAGVGDLMVTCMSPHSRNHRAGKLLAKGLTPDEVREEIGQTVEGLRTAPILASMASELGVPMHICEAIADIATGSATVADAVRLLMSRPPSAEFSLTY